MSALMAGSKVPMAATFFNFQPREGVPGRQAGVLHVGAFFPSNEHLNREEKLRFSSWPVRWAIELQ